MSPSPAAASADTYCFPRVSGDEPEVGEALRARGMFSPRERG